MSCDSKKEVGEYFKLKILSIFHLSTCSCININLVWWRPKSQNALYKNLFYFVIVLSPKTIKFYSIGCFVSKFFKYDYNFFMQTFLNWLKRNLIFCSKFCISTKSKKCFSSSAFLWTFASWKTWISLTFNFLIYHLFFPSIIVCGN